MSFDKCLEITKEILMESLGVSPDEVKLNSYLIDNLGAESIDFLDIFYQAELKVGIRITEADIAPELRRQEGDEEPDVNRKLTETELEELKKRLPPSTHDRIVPGLRVYEIMRLVNVEMLVNFFESKLAASEASAL